MKDVAARRRNGLGIDSKDPASSPINFERVRSLSSRARDGARHGVLGSLGFDTVIVHERVGHLPQDPLVVTRHRAMSMDRAAARCRVRPSEPVDEILAFAKSCEKSRTKRTLEAGDGVRH